MINIHKRVAVLIDADNARQNMPQVLKISEYYGELQICRAYGDWKNNLSSHRKILENLDIECVQVDQDGKNATDHHLLVDAGRILEREIPSDVHIFIIVSGDGDFTSACKLIREVGGKVIVIGNKKQTANTLRANCDKFYALEDLNDELSKLKELYPIPPVEVRNFFASLLYAYYEFTHKEYIWVSYGQLDAKLHQIIPTYESEFGKYKLSEWLRHCDQDFECNEKEQVVRRIDVDLESARLGCLLDAFYKAKGADPSAPLDKFDEALRLQPNYQYRFGSEKLSKWLNAYPETFEIRENHVIRKDRWFSS